MLHLKIKDTIAVRTFASLFGTIQISLVNLLFSSFGFTITPGWKPFAELFFPRYARSNLGFLVGLFGQVCISAGWGILVAFILRKTGKDYWWLKGLGIGAVSWITTAGSRLAHVWDCGTSLPPTSRSNYGST